MDWEKSTVLITGAGGAIGRHLVAHYAQRGATVVLTGRDKGRLEASAAKAASNGGAVHIWPADLCDEAALNGLVEFIAGESGQVDLLIHNAADVTSKSFADSSTDEIASLIRTNVTGPLQLTRLALPLIEKGAGKTVVFVSSLAGYKANPQQTVYSISKAAVNGASDALRTELSAKGIHCLTLALSSINTGGDARPGQVPVAQALQRLDKAIDGKEDEVFLSALSKYLMRLYAAFPVLKRAR
jgi:short-subunit dehydrogenase